MKILRTACESRFKDAFHASTAPLVLGLFGLLPLVTACGEDAAAKKEGVRRGVDTGRDGGVADTSGSNRGDAMKRVLLGPEEGSTPIVVGEEYRLMTPCPTAKGDQNPELRPPSALLATPDGMPLLLQCKGAFPNLMGGAVRLDLDGALDVYITGEIMVRAVAQTSEGDVILGGTLGAQSEYDAAIAKYDGEGVLLWSDSWQAGVRSQTEAVVVAPNGSIYATGDANGAAPGNPDTVAGGRWLARYEGNGDRMWIKQYPRYVSSSEPDFVSESVAGSGMATLVAAKSGNLYAVGRAAADDWFEVFDADGELISHTKAPPSRVGTVQSLDYLVLAPDEGSLYMASGELFNFSLEGALQWSASLATHGGLSATDEAAQPGIGGRPVGAPVLVDGNSMYIVGAYMADSHSALAYLGRYDLEGERKWVQQYELTKGVANLSIARDPDGNLMLLARVKNRPDDGFTGTYLFQVNAEDGSLL